MNTTITKIIVYDGFAHFKCPTTGRMMEVEVARYDGMQSPNSPENEVSEMGGELYNLEDAVPTAPESFGRPEDYETMKRLLGIT